MDILLGIVCAAFVFVSGRNDGAPLVAVPLQTLRRYWWIPISLLWILLPILPFCGFWAVAGSLQHMFSQSTGAFGAVVVIGTVLMVVGFATLQSIPTSITLSLVGALAGTNIATNQPLDSPLLVKVISLGLAAPLIAALLGWLLSRVPPALPHIGATHRTLAAYRTLTFPSLVAAYALNDGQKVLFCVALVMGNTVEEASSQAGLLFIASTIFCLGALTGLRRSGRFVRHGITAATPTRLLWTEAATAATVIGGSVAGIPLSMTQSLTGALLGTGIARSTKAIYWRSISRIGIAWLWTMPVSALLAYGGTLLGK
ncbi:inorganic phosphate transporter [Actinomycetaceae bacterium WB03_NA08]|uniref:Inorganic phosphate transporter n=1 Tax=Scrofimicrobium canadense TaxID=2652290 RepID=A0A6N7W511_9ACTO|nr:inorganic phosphate transporter [Scrofimicrobium canadense]MSS84405.1 inorganic phosphate transporter [Scrofimicrobium canadense]